jgi:TetR/AcrR family transcriptional repressor of lmrAB and yxaGH operons
MADHARARIEQAGADLLATHGYAGTGIKALSAAAGAPYGSLYHHFPGGKEEIAVSVIRAAGEQLAGAVQLLLDTTGSPAGALSALFEFMVVRLQNSDWTLGCTIGTPALDGSSLSEPVREACHDALDKVVGVLAAGIERSGVSAERAREVASTVFATYEGSVMMARAQRNDEPMRVALRTVMPLLRPVA